MHSDPTVLMSHPDIPETATAPVRRSVSSFEKRWSKKGWVLADSEGVTPEDPDPVLFDLDEEEDSDWDED